MNGQKQLPFHRLVPRVLQIGLLTPCNLDCSFCYRDLHAPSLLTTEFLLELLRQADEWGVAEVAFGGGEPLMFRGFAELLRELHSATRLGLNFTTNGTLLSPSILDEVAEYVGEIRLSAYHDNHYCQTLKLAARRATVGVNWLVTPDNIGMIEPFVEDVLRLGASNVLLLGYKGTQSKLLLGESELDRLRKSLERLHDVCWHPLLKDLPHLFDKSDCGAGDEFLVITPDRALQPCSFHHERIPFETFDDLKRIYLDLQRRRSCAATQGCTRASFASPERPPLASPQTFVWQAFASNNSGDWTIMGRFRTAAEAQQAAEALRSLARDHEQFVASPEGDAFMEDHACERPTPPLVKFGDTFGFDRSQPDDGLWWEELGCGAPVRVAKTLRRLEGCVTFSRGLPTRSMPPRPKIHRGAIHVPTTVWTRTKIARRC